MADEKYLPGTPSWFRLPEYVKNLWDRLTTLEADVANIEIPEITGYTGEVTTTEGTLTIENGIVTAFTPGA